MIKALQEEYIIADIWNDIPLIEAVLSPLLGVGLNEFKMTTSQLQTQRLFSGVLQKYDQGNT